MKTQTVTRWMRRADKVRAITQEQQDTLRSAVAVCVARRRQRDSETLQALVHYLEFEINEIEKDMHRKIDQIIREARNG